MFPTQEGGGGSSSNVLTSSNLSLSSASKTQVVNFSESGKNIYLSDTNALSVGDEITFINQSYYPSDICLADGTFIAPLFSKSQTRLTLVDSSPLFQYTLGLKHCTFTHKWNETLENYLTTSSKTTIAGVPRVYNNVLYIPVTELVSSVRYAGILKLELDASNGTKTISVLSLASGITTSSFTINIYNGKGYAYIPNKMYVINLSTFSLENTLYLTNQTLSSSTYDEINNEQGFFVPYTYLTWCNPNTKKYTSMSSDSDLVCDKIYYSCKGITQFRYSLGARHGYIKVKGNAFTYDVLTFENYKYFLPVTANTWCRVHGFSYTSSSPTGGTFSVDYITTNGLHHSLFTFEPFEGNNSSTVYPVAVCGGTCIGQVGSNCTQYPQFSNNVLATANGSVYGYQAIIGKYIIAFGLGNYYMTAFEIT